MATLDYSRVVEAGKGWTKVQLNDGTIVTVKGDRATRNNNPGNIEYGGFTRSQGAIGTDGRFAVFPTREAGIAAQAALIFSNPNYQDLTLAEAIAKYAPPNENNTTAYADKVSEQSGVSLDTVMRDVPATQRKAVVAAMQGVEGNHPVKAYHEDGSLAYSIKPNESGKLQSRGDMYGQAAESMGEAEVRSVAGLGAQPGGGPAESRADAGGLGALFSGDWVAPMLDAYREQAGSRPLVDGLATRSTQPVPERFGPAPFGGNAFGERATPGLTAPNFARDLRGQRQTAPTQATVLQAAGNLPGHNIAAANNFGLAHGPAGLMRTGLPDTVVRSTTVPEPAQRYGVPNPNTGFLMMNTPGVKGDRTQPATMPTASIDPYADPRAAAYASGIKPGVKQVVTPQSMLSAAKTLDKALGPVGTNIMRIVDAVRSPGNRAAESFPAGTEEMAGRTRSPIRKESKGQPGANYAGSGLSAISSVRSGHSPVGTYAQSRSNPSVSVVSLPGGNVAHVNDKMGFISTWSEADQDEKGVHYGKTLAIDPTGSKYGYFSPGKVPTGWATYSHGKGFKGSIAPGKTAAPTFGPGIFGMFGNKSAGKSSAPSLGGFLSGLFGGRGVAPGKSLGNQAVGQAVGLAAGLFGPAAGMGGLGLGGGFGGPARQVGGLGAPGFGGQISSNNNYGGK